ncbi:MAG: PadR family transcriptional regulator [Alphaproteobacteria bacterium]
MKFSKLHQRLERHGMRRGSHWSDHDNLAGPRAGRHGPHNDNRSNHGGGGRRRMFDNGELRLILLHLVSEQPRHGYDIIRAIEELSGGAYAPSPGVVYPTLAMLSDMGQLTEQAGDSARKAYAIADAGKAHLAEHAKAAKALLERLGEAADLRERTDAKPVRRAMHNLKSVLMDKLADRSDKEMVLKAVALLDEAAQKIERL